MDGVFCKVEQDSLPGQQTRKIDGLIICGFEFFYALKTEVFFEKTEVFYRYLTPLSY
ncbi:hypothetical protein LTSESEN_1873 [Salmonella enterica subsp. enterica serovar Senftenberg str. A4-543]|uniref:Uncharacterized protein n=4 Tax=Salmonella TaxID=590 RepID=G5QYG0_SALSE|nr:hypothetical protein LTSESEN_1873 [Salmonella enterica subsp. enterica serovar Senftenberg str. A4-543]